MVIKIGKSKNKKNKTVIIRSSNISLKNLLLCLILALAIIIAITFILALISTNSNALDNYLSILEIVTIVLALLISGFICGRRSRGKGLYHGLILGALVAIVIMAFSLSNSCFAVIPFVIKTISSIIAGGIGGIIGVK